MESTADTDKKTAMPKPGTTLRQMTDAEALEWIEEKYKYAVTEKLEALERAERYDNVYQALDPPDLRIDTDSDRIEEDETLYANSFLPVVAAKVDTAVVNVHNTLFDAPEYFRGDADDEFDDLVVKAKIVPHMVKTHQQIKFRYTVFKAILSAACFDYGVTLAYWQLEPGYIPDRETFIEDVNLAPGVTLPRRRIDFKMRWVPDKIDRFNLRYLPFRQCFHDPASINGFEDSAFFFFYEWVDFALLKERAGGPESPKSLYYNLDAIEKAMEESVSTGSSHANTEAESDTYIDGDRVKVITCITKDHLVEKCGDQIIRRQDLFDWPCQLWTWTEKEASFRGIGLIQRVEREQLDINATMSDRRDYWNIALHPPWVVDQSLLKEQGGVVEIYPGQSYVKSDSNADPRNLLYPAVLGGTPPSAPMQEMGFEIGIVEQVMGVSQNLMGQYATGRRTATEAGQVGAGQAARFGGVVEKFEVTALEPIYLHQFRLNQLYMTREMRFKHYGEDGYRAVIVSGNDYKMTGSVCFTAVGSRHLREDAVNNQQFIAGMDRALQFPQYNNLKNLFKDMWKRLAPKEYNKYLVDETAGAPNIPPNVENMIMAQGHTIAVSPANDHEAHLAAHGRYKMMPDYQLWPSHYRQRMEAHERDHQGAMQQANAGGRTNSLTTTPGGPSRVMQGVRPPSIGVTP